MGNFPYVMTREEHDQWYAAQLVRAGYSPEQIAHMLERAYPKDAASVKEELEWRGVVMEQTPVGGTLRSINGLRVWYKSDIDALVDRLAGQGKLTFAARCRKDLGVTYAEWQDIEAMVAKWRRLKK